MKESRIRSFLKALSWRIVASLTIVVIAFQTTGNIDLALKIGGIEFFFKFLLYYAHERLWQLVPEGAIESVFKKRKTQ